MRIFTDDFDLEADVRINELFISPCARSDLTKH